MYNITMKIITFLSKYVFKNMWLLNRHISVTLVCFSMKFHKNYALKSHMRPEVLMT